MPLCCIGGVCIPYSALVPLLLYALKWFVDVFGHYLPETWRMQLVKWTGGGTGKTTADSAVRVLQQQQKEGVDDDKTATTKSSTTDFSLEKLITKTSMPLIENEEDWKECLSQFYGRSMESKMRRIVVVKFTASWCKPCKALQPTYQDVSNQTYEKLSKESPSSLLDVLFVQMDSDQCDEIADSYNVNMLPTTCILELLDTVTTKEIARYGGSDELKLRQFIKHNIK